jgi:RecA-family ATPase
MQPAPPMEAKSKTELPEAACMHLGQGGVVVPIRAPAVPRY